MNLEEEAKEFTKKRASSEKLPDKTALRFYAGCALSGLLARGGRSNRPEEAVEEAFKYAELALHYESEL